MPPSARRSSSLPALAREGVGWILAGALAFALARAPGRAQAAAAALALAFAGGALGAFRERLVPFTHADGMLARARALGEATTAARPELASPLSRVRLGLELDPFAPNTAWAAGLSSLDGYSFPNRRFVTLVGALRQQEHNPAALLLRFPEDHRSSFPLYTLYNVAARVEASSPDPSRAGQVRVTPLVPTLGEAWFSAGARRVGSWSTLAGALLTHRSGLHILARDAVWLVPSDAAVASARLPEGRLPECDAAGVKNVRSELGGQRLSPRRHDGGGVPADDCDELRGESQGVERGSRPGRDSAHDVPGLRLAPRRPCASAALRASPFEPLRQSCRPRPSGGSSAGLSWLARHGAAEIPNPRPSRVAMRRAGSAASASYWVGLDVR